MAKTLPALIEPDWPSGSGQWAAETVKLASAKWRELVEVLAARGPIGGETAAMIEIYAVNYARWRVAEMHVAEHGPMVPAPRTGVPMYNPYLAVANGAAAIVTRLDGELMLSPRKRGKAGPRALKNAGGVSL